MTLNAIYIAELHECFGSMAGEWVTETGGKVEPGLQLSKDPHRNAPNSKRSFWNCVLSQKQHSRKACGKLKAPGLSMNSS